MKTVNQNASILIVDDDPVEIKLLSKILTEHQYRVTTAGEADLGLQLAMDQCPDILILDVMMPVINGYNFCQLLKNEEKQKDIKVIMVTARDELEDINIGMEMGADAYLTKPINTGELLRTIKVVQSGFKK
ncbi:MAG: PleD family two-component system response regulator [Candidatus Omnitrophota bacterium]